MSSDEDSCNRKREKFTSEKPVSKDETSNVSAGSDDCDSYGPALPPHLIAKSKDKQKVKAESNYWCDPHLANIDGLPRKNEQSEEKEVYGPQMPSGGGDRKVIGPEIPLHLLPPADSDEVEEEEEMVADEGGGYGPSVSLMTDGTNGTETFPSSLYISRRKVSPGATGAKRESWMVELPPERANSFGLGPRQFRARLPNEKDSDRSGWMETPTEKGKGLSQLEKAKRNDVKVIAQKQIEERNEEMERLVKKIEKKKKRDKSLLEIHRKKMRKMEKKEAKKREREGGTIERRPFDRNVDLQVQKFDLAQKNAVLKKAALLNDRFAQGESKFL